MKIPSLARPHRRGTKALVAVLLLTLGVTGALAYNAQRAVRSHRATAERALHDYAAFAAFLFARQAKQNVLNAVTLELYPVETATARTEHGSLPPPEQLVEAWKSLWHKKKTCRSCSFVDSVSYYFRTDLRTGEVLTTGARPVPEPLMAWVADSLAAIPGGPESPAVTFGAMFTRLPAGDTRGIGYILRRDDDGRPIFAYGFDAPASAWRRPFNSVMEHTTLLPPTLTGELPNDSLVAISVRDGKGNELFHSRQDYPFRFAATDTTAAAAGGLWIHSALRPELAEQLVIGGLPRSRLPLLLGLLALAAVLVGAAIVQIRRENELARLRAEFVSGVSHELRTPLAQIRMFAETLRLGRVRSEEERSRSLEIIDQEARRLTHLVENVLLFSRSERQASRLCPEPVELDGLICEVLEMFEPLAQARRVEVVTDVEPGIVASVDSDAVSQVLLNLLDNAVKYGPPGQTVTVRLRREGDEAWLSVEDQGPGIPPRDRRRIFEAFHRLERESESAVAGSGIGLSVVRDLAALHGGRAWVDAAPGGGACFVVALPCAGASQPPERAARPEAAPAGGLA